MVGIMSGLQEKDTGLKTRIETRIFLLVTMEGRRHRSSEKLELESGDPQLPDTTKIRAKIYLEMLSLFTKSVPMTTKKFENAKS